MKLSDGLKTYIFIATTAAGLALYMTNTFATKGELLSIQRESKFSKKVMCLIALRLKEDQKKENNKYLTDDEFKKICGINLK